MSLTLAGTDWTPRPDLPARCNVGTPENAPAADTETSTPAPTGEAPLLPAVARREDGSVQAFIDRYGGAIWSLSRRIWNGNADAEDATQEVFVEIWRHADRFDPQAGSEWTFVLTIARRRLIDRLRRVTRRKDLAVGHMVAGESDVDPSRQVEADAEQGPAEVAERGEQAAAAIRALARLSEEQRTVLRLSVFEGLSYPEIGEHLSMPLGTVKTHARRGLIRLREILHASAKPLDGPESATA
jgi:RNA polymerase sigma-70 factor (ECF subfamily)